MRAALAVVLFSLTVPATAHAARAACVPGGPACTAWTGGVTFVADGDTLDVDVRGDGTRRPVRVRVTGIQAMEQSVYSRRPSRRRGECHALAATARLEQLVRRGGGRVRLLAQDPASRSRHRTRRAVGVRTPNGWRDVGRVLVREGLALWLANRTEWAWNADYGRLTRAAAAARRGLFDGDACGAGPAGDPSVRVNWDAAGNDARNVNGEWIDVVNDDPSRALPLAGWWVRDSDLRRFVLPEGTVVPPGRSLRVHVGAGRASARSLFWGLPRPVFENAVDDGRGRGDGAYLFDPQGDLRAWDVYP